MTIKKKCLKCGYERTSLGDTPEYECPSCGIVYEKYEAKINREKNKSTSLRIKKTEKVSILTTKYLYKFFITLFIVISSLEVYKYIEREINKYMQREAYLKSCFSVFEKTLKFPDTAKYSNIQINGDMPKVVTFRALAKNKFDQDILSNIKCEVFLYATDNNRLEVYALYDDDQLIGGSSYENEVNILRAKEGLERARKRLEEAQKNAEEMKEIQKILDSVDNLPLKK